MSCAVSLARLPSSGSRGTDDQSRAGPTADLRSSALIYSPLIFNLSDSYYFSLSGHHLEHYLRNWLLITAALFLGSGIIYAARVFVRARLAQRASESDGEPSRAPMQG